MKILLVTPPLTQLNTPYPATAYLTGFLKSQGYDVVQADAALEWVLRLLEPATFAGLIDAMTGDAPTVVFAKQHATRLTQLIPAVIAFLQG